MKYVILLGDGMADLPIAELDGQTPLQVAATPNMDRLADLGEVGLVQTVPVGFPPGSDVANLSVLGYDPKEFYTGRSPLEAVSMGVGLVGHDVAFRCNLVTLSEEKDYAAKTMLDYSAGEITSGEAQQLIEEVQQRLGSDSIRFYPGISYRHLLVWNGGAEKALLTPPHDITNQPVAGHLPQGEGSDILLGLMEESSKFLADHPVNAARRQNNHPPANSIWLWGQGKKPALLKFVDKFGLKGSVISAVDLVKGIGLCAGMTSVEISGATGNIHSNFMGKAQGAIEELQREQDFVYLHVEAPDEAGHQGDLAVKIQAIEEVDKMLGYLLQELNQFPAYRIMVLPDHPTPLSIRTHSGDPVPYVMYTKGQENHTGATYCEKDAANSGILLQEGYLLMERFIRG